MVSTGSIERWSDPYSQEESIAQRGVVLVIIVEGPDGAGKTTLVQTLKDRFNLPEAKKAVNSDTKPIMPLIEWVEHDLGQWGQAKALGKPFIYDRHRLVSELIYGPVIRQSLEEGFGNYSWLSTQLSRFYRERPVFVCCLPPLSVVMENLEHTPQPNLVVQNRRLIYLLYHTWAAHYPRLVMLFDYTRDDVDELAIAIEWKLKREGWLK